MCVRKYWNAKSEVSFSLALSLFLSLKPVGVTGTALARTRLFGAPSEVTPCASESIGMLLSEVSFSLALSLLLSLKPVGIFAGSGPRRITGSALARTRLFGAKRGLRLVRPKVLECQE